MRARVKKWRHEWEQAPFSPPTVVFQIYELAFFTTNLPDGNSQFLFAFSFYWLHKQYLLAQYSLSCNLIKSLIVLCVLIRCFRNSLIGCCAILVVEPQGLIYANELNQLYSSHVSYVCVYSMHRYEHSCHYAPRYIHRICAFYIF